MTLKVHFSITETIINVEIENFTKLMRKHVPYYMIIYLDKIRNTKSFEPLKKGPP